MRKRIFCSIFVVLSMLLCLSVWVGCTRGQEDTETDAQTTDKTPSTTAGVTDAVTTAPAEETTDSEETTTAPENLWEPDMGIFNEGKVIYAKGEDGSVTATPTEGNSLGLDITDKNDLVSICYSIWFDYVLGKSDTGADSFLDISKVLAGEQEWGGHGAFHYWSKPALGYYCSSNREVIRTHMTQLYTAGVDFIILDHTNLSYWYVENAVYKPLMLDNPLIALFETIMEMRAEGLGTPYVVVWCGSGDARLYDYLYDNYYGQEKWADCFVYWDGKPFMLTTTLHDEANPAPAQFTTRCMGGLLSKEACENGQWNFLSINNAKYCTQNAAGEVEQIPVCVASQETYMSADTAHGRIGGLFWYAQWTSAFKYRPKFVTLTWWNEWTAQRLYISEDGGPYDGQYHFPDVYSPEYSRDIEPMEGGHGDQYYRWMIEYIFAYKNHKDCPMLVEDKYLSEEYANDVYRFIKKYEKGISDHTP